MRPDLMIVDDSDEQLLLMKNVFRMVDPALKIVTADSGDVWLQL